MMIDECDLPYSPRYITSSHRLRVFTCLLHIPTTSSQHHHHHHHQPEPGKLEADRPELVELGYSYVLRCTSVPSFVPQSQSVYTLEPGFRLQVFAKRGRSKLTEGLRDLVLVLWRRVMTSKSTVVILWSLSTTCKLS